MAHNALIVKTGYKFARFKKTQLDTTGEIVVKDNLPQIKEDIFHLDLLKVEMKNIDETDSNTFANGTIIFKNSSSYLEVTDAELSSGAKYVEIDETTFARLQDLYNYVISNFRYIA
jgi:hypothetical protein